MIPSFGDATAAARRIQADPNHFSDEAQTLAAFVLAGQDTERLRDDVDLALGRYGMAFTSTQGATEEQRAEWFEEARLALRRVREALGARRDGCCCPAGSYDAGNAVHEPYCPLASEGGV